VIPLAKWRLALTLGLATITFLGAISCNSTPPDPAPADAPANPAAAVDKIKEADLLYDQRADLAKARAARALLRQAQIEDDGNYEATWKLSRANYFIGAHTENDNERDEAFTEGINFGKAAIKLQDGKPEGHFWLGANYGGDAEHSTLAGLGNFEDIRRELETVLKLDETFQSGSAYLGLGRLYLRAPKVLGGDTQKAIDYLEKGIKIGNDNALMHSTLAEAYHAAGQEADAKRQIEFLEQMKPDAKYQAEYDEAMSDVKKLKEKMQ
jgi:tetratricopeptide (TPR) repeat protein